MSIKDMVKDGKTVSFVQFREGNFIYKTEDGFEFPVPLSDIGNATMLAKDKAILFMRYIRKHIELLGVKNKPYTVLTKVAQQYGLTKEDLVERGVALEDIVVE